MILQALAIWLIIWIETFPAWIWARILLGIGTAMVYPPLLTVVSDRAPGMQRVGALWVYRI